jgi:hypothetical protein
LALNSGGDIFAGTRDSGIFRSTDSGDTWTQINSGLTYLNIQAIIIDATDHIFAATRDGGIFRSNNDGNIWGEINTGLTNMSILSLAIDSDGYLFAGSSGNGVFRTTQQTTSVETIDQTHPTSYVLFQNYPNPFNPRTVISWQLALESEVELSIYNTLGEKVTTLVAETQVAGSHMVEWDVRGMASGIYLYRLIVKNPVHQFVQTKKLVLLR